MIREKQIIIIKINTKINIKIKLKKNQNKVLSSSRLKNSKGLNQQVSKSYAFISFQYALEEHHAGFKVLSSRLKTLENLHLGGNQCNDSIFPSLTGFSSLKSLDLSYNQLTGSINSKLHSLYQEN